MKIELDLTVTEAAVVDEIRSAAAFRAYPDILRVALYKFAVFLDVPVPDGAFNLPFHKDMRALLEAEARDREGHQHDLFADTTRLEAGH